ncbi:MAG: MopE-related protein [Pseudomonadota bacterium]|nr:MopE-related protein [Pseudomonadota bacterium]
MRRFSGVLLMVTVSACEPAADKPDTDAPDTHAPDTAEPDTGCAAPSTWYTDADGDGYGDATTAREGCPIDGDVADATDCDDTRAEVSPAATETCDGVDQDCDGAIDDDATDAAMLHADADGDGYGDAGASVLGCEAAGYLVDASDCDDTNADTHPGAAEVCDDGVDQDCDGLGCRLSGVLSLSRADVQIDGTTGSQTAPAWVVGDVTGDGRLDLMVSSESRHLGSWAGEAWLFAGPVSGTHAIQAADTALYSETGSAFGSSCAAPIDLDLDGQDDLFVGYDAFDDHQVHGFYGPIATALLSDSAADVTITGTSIEAFAQVMATGDIDGDGARDLVIPSYLGADGGAVRVFATPLTGALDQDDATAFIAGSDSERLGYAVVSPGDVDGDGTDDLLIGAYGHDTGGMSSVGAAYLFLGPLDGLLTTAEADATLLGQSQSDNTGQSVAAAGDQDGDGLPDLLVGAAGYGDAGTVYLAPGTTRGELPLLDAGTRIDGDAFEGADFPTCIAGGDDIDGDGHADLLASMKTTQNGTVYGFYGPLSTGAHTLADADFALDGENLDDRAGETLSLDDLDGDGLADIVVGTTYSTGGARAGKVYVVSGSGI